VVVKVNPGANVWANEDATTAMITTSEAQCHSEACRGAQESPILPCRHSSK